MPQPSRRDMANAIRFLSMDAVQKANSGHPGMPMGMADIAQVLWCDHLKHNPANPAWADRDRFVLSNGHGSMLIYSLLHLTGYDLTLEDLKNFRQFGSKTPGHPEYGMTPGVETTTGPLGQGVANAVGMALAERLMADAFNKPGFDLVDHRTWCFCGDGCLMEGVSHEACSLAGTLGLSKLTIFYDDNNISIDGEVSGWFTDDTPKRFEAYGWHVVPNVDGHDPEAVARAIEEAKAADKPSLICCKTVIGYGSPKKAGAAAAHGAPLGDEEIAATRDKLGWPHPPFEVPQDIRDAWDATAKGAEAEAVWNDVYARYAAKHPEDAAEFQRRMDGDLPDGFYAKADAHIRECAQAAVKKATRQHSKATLGVFGPMLPEFLGGSADLTGSNGTLWDGAKVIKPGSLSGNYLYYGVREFGMSAIMNGLALHGGFMPYGGTFLIFSDYARNAIRLASLMGIRCVWVLTHDSIGLGEDGPTHQPIGQIGSLRLMPKLQVWRPCDGAETAVAWKCSVEHEGASVLALTRQGAQPMAYTDDQLANIERGGYVLKDCEGAPEVIIMATGSEVGLAMQAADMLDKKVRVVSMPCLERFEAQDEAYQHSVLPPEVTRRVAVEAGAPDLWFKYVGSDGRVVGIKSFGESAPADELFTHFGITAEAVAAAAG